VERKADETSVILQNAILLRLDRLEIGQAKTAEQLDAVRRVLLKASGAVALLFLLAPIVGAFAQSWLGKLLGGD
jgi:hypothetical protein